MHKKIGVWAGWALFLVRVAGSVTVTGPEVPSRGRSGPQKSQPEPFLLPWDLGKIFLFIGKSWGFL